MPKRVWEVDFKTDTNPDLKTMLNEGWEPFSAFVSPNGYITVGLRRLSANYKTTTHPPIPEEN